MVMQKMPHTSHQTEWVTVSMDEYQSMRSTLEVLADEDLMRQLRRSEDDVKAGKGKKWEQLLKELRAKSK